MKTILITGSAQGLGKELALKFANSEFNIIINDKNKERLEDVREKILFPGWANCDAVCGDLRERETIDNLGVLAKERDVDILINNAGILSSGSFKDINFDKINDMIKVNLIAPIELTKAVYPIFLKKKSGLIININSIAGKAPNSEEAVYCASKYGLRGFFDSFRFEAARHNVRVISVYLGAMNTTMAKGKPDREMFICPLEVADFIFNLCKDYETLRIPEIDIWRKNH